MSMYTSFYMFDKQGKGGTYAYEENPPDGELLKRLDFETTCARCVAFVSE